MDDCQNQVIEEWQDRIIGELRYWGAQLRVRTRAGGWESICSVLMPGDIVPGDGSRDDGATVDRDFHSPDGDLLRCLGAVDRPAVGRDLSVEPGFKSYLKANRAKFKKQDSEHNPQDDLLVIRPALGVDLVQENGHLRLRDPGAGGCVLNLAEERAARLALCGAVRVVLRNALTLVGVEAPTRMARRED